MASTDIDRYEASLRDVDVGVTRTSTADFGDALADAVVEPAVGVELPFEGVSLSDGGVRGDPTVGDLQEVTTGVTPAVGGIEDYGSLLLAFEGDGAEHLGLYPERHVAVVAASDVVPDMPAAFDDLDELCGESRRDVVIATGPSATADMGSLVQGVHGPAEVHAILLEDR